MEEFLLSVIENVINMTYNVDGPSELFIGLQQTVEILPEFMASIRREIESLRLIELTDFIRRALPNGLDDQGLVEWGERISDLLGGFSTVKGLAEIPEWNLLTDRILNMMEKEKADRKEIEHLRKVFETIDMNTEETRCADKNMVFNIVIYNIFYLLGNMVMW